MADEEIKIKGIYWPGLFGVVIFFVAMATMSTFSLVLLILMMLIKKFWVIVGAMIVFSPAERERMIKMDQEDENRRYRELRDQSRSSSPQ